MTSTAIISFVRQDGTQVALPMIAEYFSMSCPEGIKIEGKEVTAEGVKISFTPTEEGTYELTFNIYGITTTITLNVKDGGALIPVPLPEQDILIPDIPKPYIPGIRNN